MTTPPIDEEGFEAFLKKQLGEHYALALHLFTDCQNVRQRFFEVLCLSIGARMAEEFLTEFNAYYRQTLVFQPPEIRGLFHSTISGENPTLVLLNKWAEICQ